MNLRLPRRILMTADTVGGVWTYAMELCRAFESLGIEVALATMGARLSGSQWTEVGWLSNTQVFESEYKLEWMDSPWADVAAAGDWLLGLEKRFSPDLVHLNGYAHASLPWEVPKIVVAHSCVLSWWEAVKGTAAGDEWNTYRDAVREGVKAADLVIAPSRAMLNALREHYGALENCTVIPNGRAVWPEGGSSKENIIFAAGRVWDEAKNIAALESAAPALSWPVYIAGDNTSPFENERSETKGMADLSGTNGAHFLGRLCPEEMQAWLGRAAIYAFPAKYEPFGLSVLEAALAGCALVLGDIPSLREIWGDAALYVSPTIRDALHDTIERLIEYPELRGDFGDKARIRAAEYSVERMTSNYLKAYSSVLGRKRQPESELEAACVS